jgi:hypothetical protein
MVTVQPQHLTVSLNERGVEHQRNLMRSEHAAQRSEGEDAPSTSCGRRQPDARGHHLSRERSRDWKVLRAFG